MSSKPKWVDTKDLPDPKIELHVGNVVTYLKLLHKLNIKAVAEECHTFYPRAYHCYHDRIFQYERKGLN
jgi:hypothetical protein